MIKKKTSAKRPFFRNTDAWLAAATFFCTFIIYLLTAEPTASFWDCPEYITTAAKLEIGHPPGNPTWTLAARMAATLAPANEYIPLFINLSSALFTALAAMLLFLSIPKIMGLGAPPVNSPRVRLLRRLSGLTGALSFAFLDSTWFSAVEAEVYACSIFCTALCIYLALKWAEKPGPRLLILIAYITGLSIGVHQLNLLCIPAMALIMLFGRIKSPMRFIRVAAVLLLSFLVIACILFGMMPGMVAIASIFEITATDRLLLPYHYGTLIYALGALLFVSLSAIISTRTRSSLLLITLSAISLSLSGVFAFGGNPTTGTIISIAVSLLLLINPDRLRRLAVVSLWSIAFLMLGFSTFALIIIRSAANPPMNQGSPSDIFAFATYLGRDQYGSTPLLHGRTPHSNMLRRERLIVNADGDTVADYSETARIKRSPRIYPAVEGASLRKADPMLTSADSAFNQRRFDSAGDHYVIAGYNYEYLYAPELDMWLPRITSSSPDHLEAYESWIGMTDSSMLKVEASEAIDSLGNAVGKLDHATGLRVKKTTSRPTYLQNLEAFASYQLAYMYFRYLLWNFAGRQNDVPSQGQVDAGNFITGFEAADALMLGPQDAMPSSYGNGNPGHNGYYLIPLTFVLLGIYAQVRGGRQGDRRFYIVLTLFFMTGIAIVLYLNQSPCEPRERDYSFIGSFYACCIWLGTGAGWLASRIIRLGRHTSSSRLRFVILIAALLLPLGVPALLLAKNYDDHDRSGRTLTSDFAFDTLESLDKDAIIFVAGDNYTFPLWYAQEVEGVRTDVHVINNAYLNAEWYPRQFLIPGPKRSPLALFATPRHLAYGNLVSARIPSDTTAVDARTAFKYMYESDPDKGYAFPSSRIRIPSARRANDSIIIDLKHISGGKSTLGRRQIVTLDIIASNAYLEQPRAIYWSAPMPDSQKISFVRNGLDEGLAIRLTETDADTLRADDTRMATLLLNLFRYGNLDRKGAWTDEPGKSQVRILRRTLRSTAASLLDRGDKESAETALSLMKIHCDKLPCTVVPFNTYSDRYIMRNEAVETAGIYERCAKILGRNELHEQALAILEKEITTAAQWRNYYNLLPERLRGATSPHVKTAATNLYAPISAYLALGGDKKFISSHPLLQYIDLKEEASNWRIRSLRRQLLHDARFPLHPDSTEAHLKEYLQAGGKGADLLKYKEITGAKDFPAIPQ